ncbi:protein SSUH2 homolog isoform X1 [Perca fluviatilis]|uniref:protein SSUH2 homolog isoform X1 n=1 Tax=Perca fluviatilis TaxID=8168 RepID=UPI001962B655|nr:protein SSUH2 homolog isoform X1 [Perca fluviatilis]
MDDQDEDLGAFDPNIPEEGPSAPPPGWLDDVHGYQVPKGEGDNPLYPPPPDYNPQPELNKNTLVPIVRVPTVSEDVARDALLKFVESKWRYSSKPARNLTFKELQPVTVYRYRLETYTETRTSAWQFESYNGQVVDGPQFGMSPPPWDIPVPPPARYTDKVEKVRVPHSSFVKPCHKCNGCGRTRCGNCHGRGQKRCTFCHGHGRSRDKRCTSCHGRGRRRSVALAAMAQGSEGVPGITSRPGRRVVLLVAGEAVRGDQLGRDLHLHHQSRPCDSYRRCSSCHGQGYNTCSVCHGSQRLLHFIQLTVTWKNDITEFIPDRQPDFPDKKFEKVTGDPFFVDESMLVYPIQGFPDQEICDVSTRMINEHLNRFSSTSRILQQRQTIEMVPLTHAYYTYNGKDYSFFVYGVENRVFAAKYPTACTIL